MAEVWLQMAQLLENMREIACRTIEALAFLGQTRLQDAPMTLSNDQVKHIAKLARLRLSEAELPHYANEINSILKWIEQLQAVNTDGVEALASVSQQALPWRDDVVNDGNKQADVLANATGAQYGCFAVPKVIE